MSQFTTASQSSTETQGLLMIESHLSLLEEPQQNTTDWQIEATEGYFLTVLNARSTRLMFSEVSLFSL